MRILLALCFASVLWPAESFVQVSRTNPRYLELNNGEPYIPIGPNIAFDRVATTESEIFSKTESRFRALAANGGNFARIWLSHPFYDLDPDAPQEETRTKLRRIGRLLEMARTHGIRLQLSIEHFRTLADIPPPFAGSITKGRPGLAARFGSITQFFTEAPGREWSLRKLDLLASQYSGNSAVFGWELWNEINGVSGTGWEEWTRAMLPELKRRFPRHLALQSLGSFGRPGVSDVYQRFSTMPGNEIASVHRYLDPGAALPICHGPFDVLAADAVTIIRGFAQDRPVLMAEVGAVEANHAGPSKLYEKDREGILLHDGVFAPFFAGAAGPGQFWHWQDYIEKNNLWFWYARFAEAVRGIDPRAEEFEPVSIPHDRLRIYALRGKRHTLIWVRDSASDWQSELVDGKPAAMLTGVTLRVDEPKADVYDPWSNRHTSVKSHKGSLVLPPFRRSLVLRIETPRV